MSFTIAPNYQIHATNIAYTTQKTMNLKQKYRSPDNRQLKKIADYLIYVLLPFIQTSLALAETQGLISLRQAFWGGLAATFLLINTKFLTKFTTETPTTAPTLDGDGC
jgi:hypothetical protein